MFHYQNAIIDSQTGTARIGYFGRVLNTSTGAVIPIFADESGTPVSVVSGFANLAKTDDDGNLAFYVAPGTYHIDIYDTDAETFIRRFSNVVMTATQGVEGDPGPEGPPGPSNNTRASLAALKGAAISDKTSLYDGSLWTWVAGDFTGQVDDQNIVKSDSASLSVGAWVRQKAEGVSFRRAADTPVRSLGAKASDVVSVNDYAGGAEPSDWTATINAAILATALRGGGEIIFGERDTPYQVNGPVLLPGQVRLNLNGQTLNGAGAGTYPAAMLQTAYLSSGALVTNIGTADESNVVQDSLIRNGIIQNAGRALDLFNYCQGCAIEDIRFINCRQPIHAKRCFYTSYKNLMAAGSSDENIPAYHFNEQANDITLLRVSATTAWGFHFEGGCTAITMTGCSFEGGVRGIALTGDVLGLKIDGMYAEAVQGRLFDLRAAGVVRWSVEALYASYVDILIDDGGSSSTGIIFGTWSQTNGLFNVGVTMGGFLYRGLVLISAPGHRMRHELFGTLQGQIGLPANYTVSPLTDLTYVDTFSGASQTDYRVKARLAGGLIPKQRTGDVGDPFPGTIPYTTSALPVGAAVSLTINTEIKWRPSSLFARFIVKVIDNSGTETIAGEVLGDIVKRADASTKTVTASSYTVGSNDFLRLVISPINNTTGSASRTGVVEIAA